MVKKIFLFLITTMFIFVMSNLSFAMICGGHSGSQQLAQAHSEHEHGTTEATKDTVTKESVNAGNKVCPVSGERIDEKTKAAYEYEGKIYNFCCAECIDEFKKDPEKYIKKAEQELNPQTQEGKKEEMKMMPESMPGMPEGHHH